MASALRIDIRRRADGVSRGYQTKQGEK